MSEHTSKSGHVTVRGGTGRPNSWLRELGRVRKSRWDVGHSLRAALAVGLPWAIFLTTGSAIAAMWVYFGALRAAMSEPGGDYRLRFKPVLLGPLIGAIGFLASHLSTMPWGVTVVVMASAGYLAAVASSYSAQLSSGATQALLVACLSIGLPEIASGWMPVLLYLSGVTLYAALLGIEMLCRPGAKRHHPAVDLLAALGDLAVRRAAALPSDEIEQPEVEEARRVVTACLSTLGALTMRAAAQHFGRGDEAGRLAATLSRGDAVFAAIMATDDREALQATAAALHAAATGQAVPPTRTESPLDAALADLLGGPDAANTQPSGSSHPPAMARRAAMSLRLQAVVDPFAPSRAVLISAAAVALCLAIAYAARWLDSAEHWFWIPLTVSMVMKPDLGSVFARAVLRVAGTVIGAAIGAVILLLVPKGVWLAVPLALFAGLAPLAAQRSYGLLAATITPIILIAVSTADPAPVDTAYVVQRIINTAIGGAIVLVFGYFIWPRTHYKRLSADFYRAKQRVADYMLAAASRDEGAVDSRLPAARREAYRNLMDMRTHLRAALAEPPPASDEAAAWFPLIAAAARICDHVTSYAASTDMPVSESDARALEQLAAFVAATPEERSRRAPPSSAACSPRLVELFRQIGRELQHMDRLRDDRSFLAMSTPRHLRMHRH